MGTLNTFTPSATAAIVAPYGSTEHIGTLPVLDPNNPDLRITNTSLGAIDFAFAAQLVTETVSTLGKAARHLPPVVVETGTRTRGATLSPGAHRLEAGQSMVIPGAGAASAYITFKHHGLGSGSVSVSRGRAASTITY